MYAILWLEILNFGCVYVDIISCSCAVILNPIKKHVCNLNGWTGWIHSFNKKSGSVTTNFYPHDGHFHTCYKVVHHDTYCWTEAYLVEPGTNKYRQCVPDNYNVNGFFAFQGWVEDDGEDSKDGLCGDPCQNVQKKHLP